jgi:hypothetical protein
VILRLVDRLDDGLLGGLYGCGRGVLGLVDCLVGGLVRWRLLDRFVSLGRGRLFLRERRSGSSSAAAASTGRMRFI